MSTPWERTYAGFRLVQTRHGDTLRQVAARELGDASRWWELVFINRLVAPYLTDDPVQVATGVLRTGATLSVPSSADFVPAGIDPVTVFGSDIALTQGRLTVTNGDLARVAGAPNLVQALRHVLATDFGALPAHPAYGCGARALVGRGGSPATQMLADGLVRRCVQADQRITAVVSSSTSLTGDVLRAEVTAEATNGAQVYVPA